MSITRSEISRNHGGGIFNRGGLSEPSLSVTESKISENEGIALENSLATATLTNTLVSGNVANFAHLSAISNTFGTLALINSTVKDNSARFGGSTGIINQNEGESRSSIVTLVNSTVSNNTRGGVLNYASAGSAVVTVINSTVSGNLGTGIHTSGVGDGTAVLRLMSSTVTQNAAGLTGGAGGIQNVSINNGTATVEIANTIIAANLPGGNIGSNGTFTSLGYNLSDDAAGGGSATGPGGLLNSPGDIRNTNPLLGPLQHNGGPTMTHALLANSPAINAGDPNFDPNGFTPPLLYDQRSSRRFPRVVNGRIDIGAFENGYR
jgi:hypothetical protein